LVSYIGTYFFNRLKSNHFAPSECMPLEPEITNKYPKSFLRSESLLERLESTIPIIEETWYHRERRTLLVFCIKGR